MKLDRYERAARLFEEAMELPSERRQEHVHRAAEGDEDLAGRVGRMVAWAERDLATGAFVPESATAPGCGAGSDRLIGAVIGRYRIVSLVGEGGFGAVYQAEQERPLRRTVAMKVLKSGMDSRQVVARFEAERQALAMLEHPGIARVIDAGQTPDELGSRPYVVMELVSGEPITGYCDRRTLSVRSRLELFVMVCHAVQYAHQRGIIHRDLKPSNILVTEVDGAAAPKVIDFGIAKAIHQPLTDGLVTNRTEILGTPQYMSPEQAAVDVPATDTRSDVYSLGVVLYELLTGTTPLDERALRSASYRGMMQMILEQRLERPSTRLARLGDAAFETARRRSTDSASLYRGVRGELDWIVLKALDPERDRRYASPAALAEDLRRSVNHEPVAAAPPGAAYRIRKFVRRHRAAVAATALVMLALVGGTVATSVSMVRAADSADQALQINEFMADMLSSVDPDHGKGADVRLVEVLAGGSEAASERFADHLELQAQVRDRLGEVYEKLSLYPQAEWEFRQALALSEAVFGPDDPRSLEARVRHVEALAVAGRHSEERAAREGLAERIERVLGRDHDLWFAVQRLHGLELSRLKQRVEAEELFHRLLQQAQAAGAGEDILLGIMRGRVKALWFQLESAHGPAREQIGARLEPAVRELAERSSRRHGPTALVALEDQAALAKALLELGQYEAARDLSRTLLEGSAARLGECHSVRKSARYVLSKSQFRLGHAEQSAELRLQSLECSRREAPIVHVAELCDAIPMLDRGGRWAEGEQVARELVQKLEELGGGHGPMVLDAELAIARFVSLQGRTEEADGLFQVLLAREEEARAIANVFARMHMFHGAHLAGQGSYEQAERSLQLAADAMGDIRHGTWNSVPDDIIVGFIALYQAWGRPEKVDEYRRLQHEALHPLEWTRASGE